MSQHVTNSEKGSYLTGSLNSINSFQTHHQKPKFSDLSIISNNTHSELSVDSAEKPFFDMKRNPKLISPGSFQYQNGSTSTSESIGNYRLPRTLEQANVSKKSPLVVDETHQPENNNSKSCCQCFQRIFGCLKA